MTESNLFLNLESKETFLNQMSVKYESLKQLIVKLNPFVKSSLPKFEGKITEEALSDYFTELEKAVKNPIHQARVSRLKKLGIVGVDKVSDELLDADEMENTVRLLEELREPSELQSSICGNFVQFFVAEGVDSINDALKALKSELEKIRKYSGKVRNSDLRFHIVNTLVESVFRNGKISDEIFALFENVNLLQPLLKNQISVSDLGKVSEIHSLLENLEKIGIQVDTLKVADSIDSLKISCEALLVEYDKLKQEYKTFQKLIDNDAFEESPDYNFLKNQLPELRKRLQEKGGKSFDVVIDFILNDRDSLEATSQDLIEFLKLLRPLIKEALTHGN